jgi:3D (Asp-Asp-Asp) domain-containing protein
MHNIQKIIGVIFLMITTSVAYSRAASDRLKNHSSLNNKIEKKEITRVTKSKLVRVTTYYASESGSDHNTKAGKTSSCIPIKTVKKTGLYVVAVNPKEIPYGSLIVFTDKEGKKQGGISVDTGGDVITRKAAKNLALIEGKSKSSDEYKAPVVDIYTPKPVTGVWANVEVIAYNGPSFKNMSLESKMQHMEYMKDTYL